MDEQHRMVFPVTYEQYQQLYKERMKLRLVNFSGVKEDTAGNRTASIRSINKFIGRLKVDNKNYEGILSELNGLNLKNYLQEISNIIANSVNEQEMTFYTKIATKLNEQYEKYLNIMVNDLSKTFNNVFDAAQDPKNRLKSVFLFTTELFVCGFTFPYKQIEELLKKVFLAGTKKKSQLTKQSDKVFAYYYNSEALSAFLVQYADIFTKEAPAWVLQWKHTGKQVAVYPPMVPHKVKDKLTTFFSKYVTECSVVLQQHFEAIKHFQEELRHTLSMNGEFSRQDQKRYQQMITKFTVLKNNLSIIAMAINMQAPIEHLPNKMVMIEDIMREYTKINGQAQQFENEYEREIYELLPDCVKTENKNVEEQAYEKVRIKLNSCKNIQDCNEIAALFQEINNKKTRKALIKDINEYRKEYNIIVPYLCRIAAIIHIHFKDIAEIINEAVFADYDRLRDTKTTNYVINDKRSRNWKYICEFTKFKLIEAEKTIQCLQRLVDDLSGYNIDLLLVSLESVGRFLYLSPNCANKFTFLLNKLQNVMKQKSFSLITTSQLINCINLLKPHTEQVKKQEPNKTQLQIQAHSLFNIDITKELSEDYLRKIKKLLSTEEGIQAATKEILEQVEVYEVLGNYNYAYLLNEIDCQRLSSTIIDETISRMHYSLKISDYQQNLLWSRFLAELFNYNMVKRSFLLNFLHEIMESGYNEMGVVNTICMVLETGEEFLLSKKVTKQNQIFGLLLKLKKYILKCMYVPMLEEFKILDIFQFWEPNLISAKPQTIDEFWQNYESKTEVNLSLEFDKFLDKRNLKTVKKQPPKKDHQKVFQEIETESSKDIIPDEISENLINENKTFEQELNSVRQEYIKDFSNRIAKSTHVERVIEKKKEKKKNSDKAISLIGRVGSKFIKKEIVVENRNAQKSTSFKPEDKEQ